jgi:hypothetical protein
MCRKRGFFLYNYHILTSETFVHTIMKYDSFIITYIFFFITKYIYIKIDDKIIILCKLNLINFNYNIVYTRKIKSKHCNTKVKCNIKRNTSKFVMLFCVFSLKKSTYTHYTVI